MYSDNSRKTLITPNEEGKLFFTYPVSHPLKVVLVCQCMLHLCIYLYEISLGNVPVPSAYKQYKQQILRLSSFNGVIRKNVSSKGTPLTTVTTFFSGLIKEDE